MINSLRAITALMLVAGISLGLFAGTLIASDPQPPKYTLDERIEAQVRYYQERYDLDEAGVAQIRRELRSFRRELRALFMDFYKQNRDEFSELTNRTKAKIVLIGSESDQRKR